MLVFMGVVSPPDQLCEEEWSMFFQNRQDAGVKLTQALKEYGLPMSGWQTVGIAKGGVIVAREVAQEFGLPLSAICVEDVLVCDRVWSITGHRGAITAFSEDGLGGRSVLSLDESALLMSAADAGVAERISTILGYVRTQQEIYDGYYYLDSAKPILLCDDGVVSGKTMRFVAEALVRGGVSQLLLAAPVIPPWFREAVRGYGEVVTWRETKLRQPTTGIFYFNFDDITTEEVLEALVSTAVVPVA